MVEDLFFDAVDDEERFFAGAFFAGDFLDEDFLAGDFLDGDFLDGDFLAGDFLGDFFADEPCEFAVDFAFDPDFLDAAIPCTLPSLWGAGQNLYPLRRLN